jgi:hypothetical protein
VMSFSLSLHRLVQSPSLMPNIEVTITLKDWINLKVSRKITIRSRFVGLLKLEQPPDSEIFGWFVGESCRCHFMWRRVECLVGNLRKNLQTVHKIRLRTYLQFR